MVRSEKRIVRRGENSLTSHFSPPQKGLRTMKATETKSILELPVKLKQAVSYARVSSEEQAGDDKVSIDEQLNSNTQLAKRNGWGLVGQYLDTERYIKTKSPNKGKRVQPSGEYDDRPAFLAMLEAVKTGEIDVIICWRDDRLVRHPRVNVALEEALDEGDRQRKSKPKIEIVDATGAILDRFTMSIKAAVWKEENKRRVERIHMGKVGTLKAGGWPGVYNRLGYKTVKEPGVRGMKITLASDEEVQIVKDVFNWYDQGKGVKQIRSLLSAQGRAQKGHPRLREWSREIVYLILGSPDYLGRATWEFGNGVKMSIEIPRIIEPDQWNRVQKRLETNRNLAERNTKGVYLLQHLLVCGECGSKIKTINIRYHYRTLADGTKKRYDREKVRHNYLCTVANNHNYAVDHPHPYSFPGPSLDWQVWRFVADKMIEHPDLIFEQVYNRQAELQAQGDSLEGDISKARERLKAIEQEKLNYSRQQARGKISEAAYDTLIAECEEGEKEEREELTRLLQLKEDGQSLRDAISHARELLTNLQARLPEIDIPPEELALLPIFNQEEILRERQTAIRALCDKITVYANREIVIDGLIDPTVSQVTLVTPYNDLAKLLYQFSFSLLEG